MKKNAYYMTRREIMTRAHEMTAAALEKWPDADRRATFAAALRLAWADARQPQTLEQFRSLPGEKQFEILRKFAARCPAYAARAVKRIEDPETGEQIKVPAPAAWADWMIQRSAGGLELEPWTVAVDTVAAEAFIGLDRQPEDLPLGIILARAVKAACMRLSRVYRDAPNNRKRSRTQDGTGAILDPVSLDDPDYRSAASYPGPEPAAIVRESISTAARDNLDITILSMKSDGYTLEEIGAFIGMTHPAVIKRLKKMKTRLDDVKTEQAANDLDAAVMAAAGGKYRRPRTWTPDNASSGSTGSSSPAAALYSGSKPAPQDRPQAAQERPQAEPLTRSTGSAAAAQDAAQAAETAAEAARREAVATRSLAKLAARQARSAARSR